MLQQVIYTSDSTVCLLLQPAVYGVKNVLLSYHKPDRDTPIAMNIVREPGVEHPPEADRGPSIRQ